MHASEANIADKTATGIIFDHADTPGICWALDRAIALYHQAKIWEQLCKTGMKQKFDWKGSALRYLELYDKALELKQ